MRRSCLRDRLTWAWGRTRVVTGGRLIVKRCSRPGQIAKEDEDKAMVFNRPMGERHGTLAAPSTGTTRKSAAGMVL